MREYFSVAAFVQRSKVACGKLAVGTPSNAANPTLRNVARERSSLRSAEQPLNAPSSMLSTEEGNVISSRFLQLKKA